MAKPPLRSWLKFNKTPVVKELSFLPGGPVGTMIVFLGVVIFFYSFSKSLSKKPQNKCYPDEKGEQKCFVN
jgi:hypothetical protein